MLEKIIIVLYLFSIETAIIVIHYWVYRHFESFPVPKTAGQTPIMHHNTLAESTSFREGPRAVYTVRGVTSVFAIKNRAASLIFLLVGIWILRNIHTGKVTTIGIRKANIKLTKIELPTELRGNTVHHIDTLLALMPIILCERHRSTACQSLGTTIAIRDRHTEYKATSNGFASPENSDKIRHERQQNKDRHNSPSFHERL